MTLDLGHGYIEEFLEHGIVVIPNILTEEEILSTRAGFHTSLLALGVDIHDLPNTAHNLAKLSSTHGSGGVLDLYYYHWKLALNEHPKVVGAMQALWKSSYGAYRDRRTSGVDDRLDSVNDLWRHPYGEFDCDQAHMFIDRVCFRIPTYISDAANSSTSSSSNNKKKPKALQRSLTPHLDCCPQDMYSNVQKWRPIQAFVSLTDTLNPNEGGLEVARGFHRDFQRWSAERQGPSGGDAKRLCVGQYTAMRPKEDAEVMARMQHVPCRAGDLVCWDVRIPHANALYNHKESLGDDDTYGVREVVYIGLLPATALNRAFAAAQREAYAQGRVVGGDRWGSSDGAGVGYGDFEFSALGRKLMGMDDWHGV